MNRVLITGATGTIGIQVIESLIKLTSCPYLLAGVHNIDDSIQKLAKYNIHLVKFDFSAPQCNKETLEKTDILFLLRPPQIANVQKYFEPLIHMASACNVKHIVFLSVQGVENNRIIPHYKIEKLIIESKIPYTFLRAAYFMQNFLTTLNNDLVQKQLIFLPAGKAKFTLVDVRDVGAVAAAVISNHELHANISYDLTSQDLLTFKEMAGKISTILNLNIKFSSPNLLKFYFEKRKEKISPGFIAVVILLHYSPRFHKEPKISDCVNEITGKAPIGFEQFLLDYSYLLSKKY